MVNVRKKEAGGRGREGRGPGVQEGGTHLEGKTERGPKEEGRRKSEGAVEEAEAQEWRRKRMGLTWRARQRGGAVEEGGKEEDREWRCKRADNEATPSQSTDMETCKGQIWRHAKGSRRRVENNRKRERAQRESREQNRRGSARRGARQSNPLPPV